VALLLALLAAGPDLSAEIRRQVARQECRAPQDGEADVTVCARRDRPRPYQVTDPKRFDPTGPYDSVARERGRWIEELDTGTGSCTAIGPGGWTGCMLKQHRRERQQKDGQFG
jgi:hypothetical protein